MHHEWARGRMPHRWERGWTHHERGEPGDSAAAEGVPAPGGRRGQHDPRRAHTRAAPAGPRSCCSRTFIHTACSFFLPYSGWPPALSHQNVPHKRSWPLRPPPVCTPARTTTTDHHKRRQRDPHASRHDPTPPSPGSMDGRRCKHRPPEAQKNPTARTATGCYLSGVSMKKEVLPCSKFAHERVDLAGEEYVPASRGRRTCARKRLLRKARSSRWCVGGVRCAVAAAVLPCARPRAHPLGCGSMSGKSSSSSKRGCSSASRCARAAAREAQSAHDGMRRRAAVRGEAWAPCAGRRTCFLGRCLLVVSGGRRCAPRVVGARATLSTRCGFDARSNRR